jgi:hypothetical protein
VLLLLLLLLSFVQLHIQLPRGEASQSQPGTDLAAKAVVGSLLLLLLLMLFAVAP